MFHDLVSAYNNHFTQHTVPACTSGAASKIGSEAPCVLKVEVQSTSIPSVPKHLIVVANSLTLSFPLA